jgi:hypothetical protein
MSVMAESVVAIWSAPVVSITNITFNNSGGAIASCTAVAFFAVTVYTVRALTSVGVPLIVQVIYTVTAKDAKDNTGSASFSLTVNVLAPNLANATEPPEDKEPHAVIEPSVLMAAKACQVE